MCVVVGINIIPRFHDDDPALELSICLSSEDILEVFVMNEISVQLI